MSNLAVVNALQLVTLGGPARPRTGREMEELAIIPNGAMLIEDGLIVSVGITDLIAEMITDETTVVDAEGCLVMPGFIDAHTHPVFGGNRANEFEMRAKGATYEDISAAGSGIWSTVEATRQLPEDDLFEQCKRYANWFLSCGTTTVEAKSGYGLNVETELSILRVIARLDEETPLRYIPTFLGAHAVPNEFKDNPRGYLALLIDEMLPRVKEEDLAEFCDVFCETGYFSLEDASLILAKAKELGMPARVHADQLTRCGGAELAASSYAMTADHLEQANDEAISALKGANVQPVLLPASVYSLGKSKYPPARRMIEAGLAVVLATDFNPGSSPTPSMPMVLSLACTQMQMTPAEAVTASTVNAAYSLGWGDEIGSLEPGKIADFVIYDCRDYRELPYWLGINLVKDVWASGMLVNPR